MNREIIKLFLFLAMTCFQIQGIAQQVSKDSIFFEILLSKEMLKPFKDVSFIPSIDNTPEGFILLSSINQFYILGWGGMIPFSESVEKPIKSFTNTPNCTIIFVQEKELCFLDSLGKSKKLFGLPDSNMKISAGKEVLYLFGNNNSTGKDIIYILFKKAKYISLLEYLSPITSILEINEDLFFSSKNKILFVDIKSKQINELLSLPNENDEIISIDYANKILYFSTNKEVYRIKNNQIELISNEFGGILKYDGEGLLIFNPELQLIIRLRNNLLYPVTDNPEPDYRIKL